ncbi:unnamed protein product [Trichogramma brassicae]|uniref:Secreted protein n=1 Tax=Trichogramma brassicae TaxID=86971 RepID=A0A6H5IPL7_9HYME|nr:unnamed protein product [Trichogramma brassicae]
MIGALLLILWIFCASGARIVQCHDAEEDQSDYPAVDYTDYVLSTTESSSSYLRNVVSELQRFHGIEPKTKPPPRRPPMVMAPVTTKRPIFRQPPTRLEPQVSDIICPRATRIACPEPAADYSTKKAYGDASTESQRARLHAGPTGHHVSDGPRAGLALALRRPRHLDQSLPAENSRPGWQRDKYESSRATDGCCSSEFAVPFDATASRPKVRLLLLSARHFSTRVNRFPRIQNSGRLLHKMD